MGSPQNSNVPKGRVQCAFSLKFVIHYFSPDLLSRFVQRSSMSRGIVERGTFGSELFGRSKMMTDLVSITFLSATAEILVCFDQFLRFYWLSVYSVVT